MKPQAHLPTVSPTRPETKQNIPSGATLVPPLQENTITKRLENLTFCYEGKTCRCLRYRCRHGHVITSHPGTPACQSCPSCSAHQLAPCTNTARRKLTICEMAAVARQRGGVLVSTTYVNSRAPLLWRCEKGHSWRATASNVRSGNSWCPECARQKKKKTIQDMREMAHGLGGECLCNEYISEHVKLRWRCAEGHEFYMAPNNIRRNPSSSRKPSWCKICRKNAKQAVTANRQNRLQQESPRKLTRIRSEVALR